MAKTSHADRGQAAYNRRHTQIEQAIYKDYRQFQYRFVEFLTAHLADCSRAFNGDLHSMLLLAIIGQVALEGKGASGKQKSKASKEELGAISASRISDISGIPRQTVRRKLELLESKGWIVRDEQSSWRLALDGSSAPARVDLNDLDRRSITRWAQLFASIEPLLPEQPSP